MSENTTPSERIPASGPARRGWGFFLSSGAYFMTTLVDRAVPFLFLPLLTRWLTPADYGFIGTFTAFRANLEPVVSMSSTGAVCRAYMDREKEGFDFPSYTFNAMLFNAGLFVVVCLTLLPFQSFVAVRLHFPAAWLWSVPALALLASFGAFKADLWVLQQRPLAYGGLNVLRSAVNIALSIAIIHLVWFDWRGRVSGILFAEAAFFAVSIFFLCREDGIRLRFDKTYFKDVASFGIPLYPHSLGLMLLGTVDKFFLNAMLGMAVLGVYNVAYALSTIIIVLATPFDLAAFPRIYAMLDGGDAKEKRRFVCLAAVYMGFFTGAAAALAWIAPWALKFLVGKGFGGAERYIAWLAMSQACFAMYRVFAKFITYSKKTYIQAWITLLAGVVATAACPLLIKLNGAVGAAQAVLIAYASFAAMTAYFAHRLHPLPWGALFDPVSWKAAFAVFRPRRGG